MAFSEHMQGIADRLRLDGVMKHFAMPQLAESIKGLKSLDSMRDKVSVALANAKVEANAIADRIDANRKMVEDMSLVPDFAQICIKAPEDFSALLAMRIQQRKDAEEKRLEAERERIRAEEQAKAEKDAAEKAAAEQAERNRLTVANNQTQFDAIAADAHTTGIGIAQIAANEEGSVSVTNIAPDQVFDHGKTIKLAEICARLGYTVSADFLSSLGFEATIEKNAKLYQESQWPNICRRIADHTLALAFKKAA